jgi:3-deoxy-D-manno-octulosonic-acid transferase
LYHELYNLLCWLILLVAAPFFLLYSLITRKHLNSIKNRLGFFPEPDFKENSGPRLWFHAASVGEVQVARALIEQVNKLIPETNFIITTVTEQGHLVATKLFKHKVYCIYAPLDLRWIIRRYIKILQPTAYICLETELWPNTLKIIHDHKIRLLLLNGRISDNSFKHYLKIKFFLKEILAYFSEISTIMPHDRDRLIKLGAHENKISVNGNAKFDVNNNFISSLNGGSIITNGCGATSSGNNKKQIENFYRKKLNIDKSQHILVAGSTHNNEEEQLIGIYKKLCQEIPDLLLILAPRHLNRVSKIKHLFNNQGLDFDCFSQLSIEERTKNIILVDLMGELTALYTIATYVFCGGSLVPKGGHNLMEPAIWGKPPFYGQYMSDFIDAKSMLESVDAGFPIKSIHELHDQILYFYNNKSYYKKASLNAEKIANEQQGSAIRQAELISKIIIN